MAPSIRQVLRYRDERVAEVPSTCRGSSENSGLRTTRRSCRNVLLLLQVGLAWAIKGQQEGDVKFR